MLTRREENKIDSINAQYERLDTVTKELQKDLITLADVPSLFDAVVTEFPVTENRLSPNARIVLNSYFESAIVKIQNGSFRDLTVGEGNHTVCLREIHQNTDESEMEPNTESLVELGKMRRRLEMRSGHSYMDTRFILPTSNICERLFCLGGHILCDRRGRLSPSIFEEQVFLHANNGLWNIEDVKLCINKQALFDKESEEQFT